MNDYLVSARKYRPKCFKEVVGQDAIVTTLKNAIKSGRIAHAYLFSGSRGTGKTTLARLFAKILNCQSPSEDLEPCNACPSCREIAGSHSLDVLEIDGASHRGIEDIRQINETIAYAPTAGKYKIYLIDEVHMLTKEAFNALLKTLEEPPERVKFFFATTEPHKIPATILSRCQRFSLNRISPERIAEKLGLIAADLGLKVDPAALKLIAQLAEGGLRDAESLFDQVIAFHGEKEIPFEAVTEVLGVLPRARLFAFDQAGAKGELQAAFALAEEIFSSGRNIAYFLEELIAHFRTLLMLHVGGAPSFLSDDEREGYRRGAACYRKEQCVGILEMLVEGQNEMKSAPSQRVALEMLLLKIIRTHKRLSWEELVARLAALEERVLAKGHISEDPTPTAAELPPPPKKLPEAPKKRVEEEKPPSLQQQSRQETVMRFAAKELEGSLQKTRNQ